jgi:hypothetical protein
MPSTNTTSTHSRVEIFDAHGRLIGTITKPVAPEVLGPGREKVYLARRGSDRTPRAA